MSTRITPEDYARRWVVRSEKSGDSPMVERVARQQYGCMRLVNMKSRSSKVIKQSGLLVSNLAFGVLWFTWVGVLLSVGIGSLLMIYGVPVLALTVRSGRVIGAIDRRRLQLFADVALEPPAHKQMPSGVFPWLRAALSDKVGWKGLAYGVVMLPWSLLTFAVVVVLWALGVGAVTAPLYDWALPSGVMSFDSFTPSGWERVGVLAAFVVVGAVVLLALPMIVNLLTITQIGLSRSLLSVGQTELLERKVGDLNRSRNASAAAAETERRRIERDLHDGTQQRLTGIAIDLGIARERLSEVGDEQARVLVDRAQKGVKEAIAELRDLVRGIHPAILTDRGLEVAISSLAVRTSIDVEVSSDLKRRLEPTVESAAYFAVAEALTNVMKHGGATSATVTIRDLGETLEVEIRDNGVGGASVLPGGGLEGMQTRLNGVGGMLDVVSPDGGPTHVKVTLPCALS
ncbi:MAG: sensor histidine kinase [Oxalobacteraceae bacterium]|nr:sensor histidine kinase [Oxalobacteraceae bacterium]